MRTQGAAPGELGGELRGGKIEGNGRNLSQLGLAPHVLERLAAEGVHDLTAWRKLGRRRLRIFGIVPSVVRKLDAAARRLQP